MVQRRALALELGEDSFPPFSLAARISEGPETVARRLRTALGLSVDAQLTWPDEWAAWRHWRGAVEAIGVLVFQFPKVPLAEARGIALLHVPVPAIGINSKETAPGARIFTLVHELIHLALSAAHEEEVALRERRSEAAWHEIERFAEETASRVIIPGESLGRLLPGADPRTIAGVRALARRFRVTPLAMATRLCSSGVLGWDDYREWVAQWNAIVAEMPPRKGGFTTPVEKTLSRAGRPLTQLVLEALDTNRITAVDASRFLDLRFDHFENLRSELGSGAPQAAE
jgi:Zn-dependent peptidase ImmA (M78 family)